MASLKDLIVMGPARFLDKLYGNLEGNAATATKLKTARTLTLGNSSINFDGSENKTFNLIISNEWDTGTTSGPAVKTIVNGVTGTSGIIPSASISASGVVTTGPQRFRGKKSFEYPIITSKDSRYLGIEYYHHNGSTMVGDHWYDVGDNTNITAGKYYWRQYSPNTTANTSTTGFHETFSLPGVTVGRTDSASYEIFTSKSYTTLDGRYVNVTGDTMTGDLKFTNKGLHFIPGDTDQYLWKVYGSVDGSFGFRLQYNGTGTGNNNSLNLIADNQQGTEVNAATMLQDGSITLAETLTISKTTDAAGTTNNKPALIVGGTSTTAHLELDSNELIAKTNGTSVAALYLNSEGGLVHIGSGGLQADASDIIALSTNADFRAIKATNSKGSVGIYAGNNRGLYDFSKGEWIIYRSEDGTKTYVSQWGTKGSSSLPVYFSYGEPIACNSTLDVSITGSAKIVSRTFDRDTSNALNMVTVYDTNGTTLRGLIGFHNTGGDGTGSAYIIPYPATTDSWSGTQGLYIKKGELRIDNSVVLTASNYTNYTVTKTGAGASGTNWGISITGSSASCTGNAASATKLATARNFTIGGTARSFNGTAAVSWTKSEVGIVSAIQNQYTSSTGINLNSYKQGRVTVTSGSASNSNKPANGAQAFTMWNSMILSNGLGFCNDASTWQYVVQFFCDHAGNLALRGISSDGTAGNYNYQSWRMIPYYTGTSTTIGGTSTPVYVSGGELKACNEFAPKSHTHSYLPLTGGSVTGAISITTNGVTNSFYSQNSSYTHYSTSASVGHWFNKAVYVQGEIYAGSSYNKRVYHMGNIVYGSEPANPVDRMIWLYPA